MAIELPTIATSGAMGVRVQHIPGRTALEKDKAVAAPLKLIPLSVLPTYSQRPLAQRPLLPFQHCRTNAPQQFFQISTMDFCG